MYLGTRQLTSPILSLFVDIVIHHGEVFVEHIALIKKCVEIQSTNMIYVAQILGPVGNVNEVSLLY